MNEPSATSEAVHEELTGLRALVEATGEATFRLGADGAIASWTRAAERLFGHAEPEAIGRDADTLFTPQESGAELIERACAGEPIVGADAHALRHDDMVVPVAVTTVPVPTGGAFVLVRDLTEQELFQSTLAESQARMDELQHLAHVGLWSWDAGTGAVQWSEELHRIHDLEPGQFDGSLAGHLAAVHPSDRALVSTWLQDALHADGELELEYAIVRPTGQVRHVTVRAEVVHEADGRPGGLRGICQDLTERKEVEQARERQLALVALLNRITAAANEATSVEHALRSCVDAVRDHIGWALGHVLFADPSGDFVYSSGVWSYDRDSDDGLRRFRLASQAVQVPRGQLLPGRVLSDGRPVWLADFMSEPDFTRAAAAERAGFRTALAFPVLVGNDIVAVVELFSTQQQGLDEHLVAVLGACGSQVGRVVERTRAAEALSHQALHDPLTQLPNRALFIDRLEHAVAAVGRSQAMLAVLFLDLDGFKVVNDSLGHDIGDVVLVRVAERLRRGLRPTDTVGRFGGDEFTILCENVKSEEEAIQVANRVAELVAQPVELATGGELDLTASVGIAFARSPDERPENLLRDADAAMYRAKEQGRARHEVFDTSMHHKVAERLQLATDLRRALPRSEFRLHYQPQVSLADGRIVGLEALIRWQHPTRGLLAPGHFIHAAEETQLIVPLGGWVLDEACRQLAEWRAEFPDLPLKVNVNVSARQLGKVELIEAVHQVLTETRLDPKSVCLEITETVIMADAEFYLEALLGLKVLGVSLAVDDFGVGYSSLAYLQRFPIDTLKIDKTFVDGLEQPQTQARAILAAAVDMAHALGLEAVAEGVESPQQAATLADLGCDGAQGYYFARPAPPEEITVLLAHGALPAL
ncbi:MAG: EAL domain-containing protein [Acidimicrobiia bacterium]|nr:EAL domain-containing protein [Acidimicrobiia bacterium]